MRVAAGDKVEVGNVGWGDEFVEGLYVKVYLIFQEALHVTVGFRKTLDRGVDVHAAKHQHAVLLVTGFENLGHYLALIHLLNITVRQPDPSLKEGFRLSLGTGDSSAKAQSE